MTPDGYINSVLAKYAANRGQGSPAYNAAQGLYPIIKNWAGDCLHGVSYSGSYAKGTAIRGHTDVDLFISLKHGTPENLRDIYMKLTRCLTNKGFSPRLQNVSIGVKFRGASVDLVPGRKQSGNTSDHSLYHRKGDTWIQTNVSKHNLLIQKCGRRMEIRALKIWRELFGLDFPSFYLELTVIKALAGQPKNRLGTNLQKVLKYLVTDFETARVVDPTNSANIISDDLSAAEKRHIEKQAFDSLSKANWNQIIW